jgi:hypothetical protein
VLEYAVKQEVWQAMEWGDQAEAARLLSLGAEVNLEVWVDTSSNYTSSNYTCHTPPLPASVGRGGGGEAGGQARGAGEGGAERMEVDGGPGVGACGGGGVGGEITASAEVTGSAAEGVTEGGGGVSGVESGAVLKWRGADEDMWGRTPLDRLVKFGGECEAELVAAAACAFVRGGVRCESAAVHGGVGGESVAGAGAGAAGVCVAGRVCGWEEAAGRVMAELQALPQACPYMCPHTTAYVSLYYYICVRILRNI